ncbi:unnamed protein product [Orchesella dallaii]|uniref:Uncharacterized protein n=1 Tax=Orchesella dallaii TaxID=48710 RepID=A0ABP1QQG0_9HEXA
MHSLELRPSCSLTQVACLTVFSTIIFISATPSPNYNNWNQNVAPNTNGNGYNSASYRTAYPSPNGGVVYRNRPEGRRRSRNPNYSNISENVGRAYTHSHQSSNINTNGILVGEICDPGDPVYNKCTMNAKCVPGDNNLHRCNCTQSYEETSDKKCLLSWGQLCNKNDGKICNYETGLVCVENRCECDNSEIYQHPSRSCRSKVGGSCTPPSTDLGIRFSKATTGCVKNAQCKSLGPTALAFRCVCRQNYLENRFGFCVPGVGTQCSGKGDCDPNIPLVCKEGVCACRDSLHIYDPVTNTCVGLSGAQCCTDPEGNRCINVRTGCIDGAFCKDTSLNLPGRCVCHPFNVETAERLCKPNLI